MSVIPNQRHLFDIPDDVAYFNTATMGPMTTASVEAGKAGLARKLRPWSIQDTDFFADTARLRPLLAQLIHADTDGIAFVPSVSYALATAAANISLAEGQEILVLEDQFPSNVYVWRALAESTGAQLKTITRTGSSTLSDCLLNEIGPNTGLVACAHIRWTDGALVDVAAVGKKCRDYGAAFVLDLTQSCGALDFNTQNVQPDFVAVAGYKWLLGPYATGFLYAAPKHRSGRPLEQNWITRKGASNFARLIDYSDEFGAGAERFDMGERSNFALLPAFESAVRTILDWGVENVERTLRTRNADLSQRLNSVGVLCPPEAERGPHYLCPLLPDSAPEDLTARLKADGIFVSRRGDRLRITQHLFTNDKDTNRLVERLAYFLRS